jgi:O-antigen ligase
MAYLVWASALIVLSASAVRDLGEQSVIRILAWSLLVGGLLSAFAGLLQQYFGESSFIGTFVAKKLGTAVYGNIGQRTHLASYTSLALLSLAYLYSAANLRGRFAVLLGIPLVLVLGLSGARIAWAFLAVMLGLVIVFWRARRESPQARSLAISLGVAAIGFALAQQLAVLAPFAPSGGVVMTPTNRLFAEMGGPSERFQLWAEAVWAFLRAPFFGWGWGGFPTMHFEYQATHDSLAARQAYHQAHNLVLQLLVETGAVGAALVVGGIVHWLWGLRRSAFSLERWWLLAALGVLAVHSLSEFPLWYAYFLGVAAVLLGVAGDDRGWIVPAQQARLVLAVLSVLGGVYLAFQLDAYREFERIFTDGRAALDGGAEQGRRVARALSDPVLRPYGEVTVAFSTRVEPARIQDRLALVRRATRFAPYPPIVYKRALLTAMAGESGAALTEFKRAIHAYPQDLPAVVQQLTELAAQDPGRFGPLLDAATQARR